MLTLAVEEAEKHITCRLGLSATPPSLSFGWRETHTVYKFKLLFLRCGKLLTHYIHKRRIKHQHVYSQCLNKNEEYHRFEAPAVSRTQSCARCPPRTRLLSASSVQQTSIESDTRNSQHEQRSHHRHLPMFRRHIFRLCAGL